MNVFSATGNLGKDCRVGNVSGTPVVNFSVAVKSGFGQSEQTVWIDCALWGKRAETKVVDYLVKGQQVGITGELGTREHEGKTYLTCRLTDVTLLGGKSGQAEEQQPRPGVGYDPKNDAYGDMARSAQRQVQAELEDDLPF